MLKIVSERVPFDTNPL